MVPIKSSKAKSLMAFKDKLRLALGWGKAKQEAEANMKSCDAAKRRFVEQFGALPGILKIEKDDFFNESIVVFFDKKKLAKHSLPPVFETFDISLYDVRYMLSTATSFLEIVRAEKVDLSIEENKTTYEYFMRTVELCKQMLV